MAVPSFDHGTPTPWIPGSPEPVRAPHAHEHPPPWPLFATDLGRAVAGVGLTAVGRALLRAAPSGDGHPVLVLPGLGADDRSTGVLRRVLRERGYRVHGWRLGFNLGPTEQVVEGLPRRVDELRDRYGTRVSVVGWSLGGVYARSVARQRPDSVRQVITLGSPIRLTHPAQTRASAFYLRHSHRHVPHDRLPPPEVTQPPLPVPATSVYSRWDGIVSWRACLEQPGIRRENVAVVGSHFGLGRHPAALWVVADRLAQPEGEWRPFRAPPPLRALFPSAD